MTATPTGPAAGPADQAGPAQQGSGKKQPPADLSGTAPILLTRHGDRIARITLNRPHKRNALDRQARQALRDALEQCRDASVVVLTGAGGTFCAGMDLSQLATRSRGDEDELNHSWRMVQEDIRHHPAIVIASVAGYALGGGATLINTCDLAVVAEDARIGTPEIGFGFYPGLAGPAAQLRLSAKRAAWMVLTAERIDGRTAEAWGMANLAVPADELDARTLELAERVAGFDPVALEWSKKALWQIPMQIGEWRAALEFGAYVNAEIHARTRSHEGALDGFLGGVRHPGQGADR
ncbi:enoyl-CoA hydratase/isomerase family protein [Actinacidiphila epipremni]|uniref:Enoyl-CoA hydratase/isomerase family protein n=1 Tax=Actinacidiphila epipremni TaxID=2053013 RepID=A0ABX0ZSD7_9ACTN|nr:enoyl-CoA hydratase/isomerase family protein [Actinacidiphila epipremni]NJP46825.1 enoyl-CoA hydratase/isomerase family protein [Actinacidiphila epipremni]